MIRKPKTHPTHGINLVGVNFRERWNVVQYATKEEIEGYIQNENFRKNNPRSGYATYWEWMQEHSIPKAQNINLRKKWRKRYSESFQYDVMYKVTKTIPRYSLRAGIPSCDGTIRGYQTDDRQNFHLRTDTVLVLNHRDELGTLYFSDIKDIGSKYTFAFPRESALLAALVPVEA